MRREASAGNASSSVLTPNHLLSEQLLGPINLSTYKTVGSYTGKLGDLTWVVSVVQVARACFCDSVVSY